MNGTCIQSFFFKEIYLFGSIETLLGHVGSLVAACDLSSYSPGHAGSLVVVHGLRVGTCVPCIAWWSLNHWAIREVPCVHSMHNMSCDSVFRRPCFLLCTCLGIDSSHQWAVLRWCGATARSQVSHVKGKTDLDTLVPSFSRLLFYHHLSPFIYCPVLSTLTMTSSWLKFFILIKPTMIIFPKWTFAPNYLFSNKHPLNQSFHLS